MNRTGGGKKRVLLHLGCGPFARRSDWIDCDGSWNAIVPKLPRILKSMIQSAARWLRVDLLEWPDHIKILNLRKPLPFRENSVDAIYASHVWEHLTHKEAVDATAECFRVLKSGGSLRIVVPDLRHFAESYLSSKEEDAADRFMEDLHLRARSSDKIFITRLFRAITDFHSHKWMYDAASLSGLLRQNGFVEITVKECWKSRIPEISQIETPERVSPETGIALEAQKPLS